METIKVTGAELYQLRALLAGLVMTQQVKEGEPAKPPITVFTGILNEPGVPEGTKRAANKALRLINAEIADIEKQRQEIQSYTEDGLSEDELVAKKLTKDNEMLAEQVEFTTELIDFSKIEHLTFAPVEGQKIPPDYSFLYDKLFK